MSFLRHLRSLSTANHLFRISVQTSAKQAFTTTSLFRSSFQTTTKMATTEPSLPDQVPTPSTPADPALPKLSQHDFRIYNRMAEHMDYFHNHFRETWNVMYAACETGKRAKGMSIRQFIAMGQQFCGSLEMHHGIEERYVRILFKGEEYGVVRAVCSVRDGSRAGNTGLGKRPEEWGCTCGCLLTAR